MTDWEADVGQTVVTRQGDEAAITAIEVKAERTRSGYSSYSRVSFACEYRVAEDDCASLHDVERGSSDSGDRVLMHHLIAVLPAVERAVAQVPGVQWVEPLEDSIRTRRPVINEDDDQQTLDAPGGR